MTIWCTRSFPRVAVLKLIFIYTWYWYIIESLYFPKENQATCSVWCGTWDSYGANEGKMGFIWSWIGVHRAIMHSWGYVSVLLVLWKFSWVLSGVPSSTLRLLTCLIGNTEFLCTQCRVFGLHLPPRGMSQGISRVAARTWGIFSSYSGDGHSKLHFVQWSQDSCLVRTDTSGI